MLFAKSLRIARNNKQVNNKLNVERFSRPLRWKYMLNTHVFEFTFRRKIDESLEVSPSVHSKRSEHWTWLLIPFLKDPKRFTILSLIQTFKLNQTNDDINWNRNQCRPFYCFVAASIKLTHLFFAMKYKGISLTHKHVHALCHFQSSRILDTNNEFKWWISFRITIQKLEHEVEDVGSEGRFYVIKSYSAIRRRDRKWWFEHSNCIPSLHIVIIMDLSSQWQCLISWQIFFVCFSVCEIKYAACLGSRIFQKKKKYVRLTV